jgi:integrase/recombinase XerD
MLHSFRRGFAKNYLRNRGNVIYLQVAMGHSNVTTTKKYVEVDTDDLREMQQKTSILGGLE